MIRLLPPDILELSRAQATEAIARPASRLEAFFIVGLWIVAVAIAAYAWRTSK